MKVWNVLGNCLIFLLEPSTRRKGRPGDTAVPLHRDSLYTYTESEVPRGSVSCSSKCQSLSAAAAHAKLSMVTYCCSERSGTWFENCCLAKRSQMSPTLPLERVGQTLLRQKSLKLTYYYSSRRETAGAKELQKEDHFMYHMRFL